MTKASQRLVPFVCVVIALCGLIAPATSFAAVGRTSGSFDVSSTGGAEYSIPIFAPPGPHGMQPSISLVYNSNGGIGPLGKGWALSGISSISRCGKTVAQDGSAIAVSLVTSDGYCLSNQRLRLYGGTYGTAGSTYQTEIAEFTLVTAAGTAGYGPAYFTAKGRDGLLYEYGNSTDSRVIATGTSTASVWMLNQITDRSGNKIKFTYKTPDSGTTGTTEPISIEWTATSYLASTFVYRMDFGYGNNTAPSTPTGYVAGTLATNDDLLTSITVLNSSAVVKKYTLSYQTSPTTGASRLVSVQECSDAGGSDCYPATSINYQDGTAGISSSAVASQSGAFSKILARRDFNGDGIQDMLYKNGSTWYVTFGTTSGTPGTPINTGISTTTLGNGYVPMLAADFRATGLATILANTGGIWIEYAWNGSGFSGTSTGLTIDTTPNNWLAIDVTGDGRADLVSVTSAAVIKTYRNTGSSSGATFAAGVTYSWISSANYPYVVTEPETNVEAFDYDGDGRKDILAFYASCTFFGSVCYPTGTVYVALRANDNLQYTPYSVGTTDTFNVGVKKYVADWNGDGCFDTFIYTEILIARCAGSSPATLTNTAGVLGAVDWNGDGRQDVLIQSGSSSLGIRLSTGTGLAATTTIGIPYSSACVYYGLDIDGDGLDDIACHQASGSTPGISYYRHNGAGTKPDLVTNIADAFQVGPTWSYTPASWSNHTKQSDSTYPNFDYQGPMYVVSAQTSPDGIGSTYTESFWYYGAAMSANGRGFSGFASRKVTDSRAGNPYAIEYYSRDFPTTGLTTKFESYQGNGTLISRWIATLTPSVLDATTNNQRYFPYPASFTEDVYQVGGGSNGAWITHTATSNTFDSWGNLTASTQTVTDEDSASPYYTYSWIEASSASFSPNTTNWCLGLATSSSITSSTTTGEASVTRSKSFTPDYVKCRIDAAIIEPSSSTLRVDAGYGYDTFGNVNSVSITGKNPNSSSMTARTTVTTWGSANGTTGGTGQFPVSETNALSQTTTRTFSSTFGSLSTETDPNGIVVASNEYDGFGRLTRNLHSDGTGTRIVYAGCATYGCQNGDPGSGATGINKMVVVRSERNSSDSEFRNTRTYTDQFDRAIVYLTQTASGGYSRTGRQYNALGQVLRDTAPCDASSCSDYWTANTYDLLGRLLTQSRPFSDSNATPVTTTFAYAGRTQTATDPNGKVTTQVFDVNGWMRRSRDHDNYGQNFSYDGAGSLVSVTDTLTSTLFSASYGYSAIALQVAAADMDLGSWSYSYDSLGELVGWQDANANTFSQVFDPLGRVTSRTEAEGTTSWTWGINAASHNIGRLAGVSMTASSYGETLSYDSLGRLITRNINADSSGNDWSSTYAIDFAYNNQGQLDTQTYPTSTSSTRVKVKYGYSYGILQTVTDWTTGSAGTVYWTANAQNPRGQVTQETLGNNVVTNRSFDAVTGWLNSIQSAVGGGTGLQNQSYAYDAVGNVTQRLENTLGLAENFYYDNLYRLDHSTLSNGGGAVTNLSMSYNAMGNISSRWEPAIGTTSYIYHSTKKHAVASAGSASYSYDSNGNMTSRDGHTIGWASYNYPTYLTTGTETTGFEYGPNRQYFKQVYTGPSASETTYYIGGLLEKVCDNSACTGTIDWRHDIVANGQTVATVSRKSTSSNTVSYPLEDNQGSKSTLTDASGTSLVRVGYSAFGVPRDGADWDGGVPSGDQAIINAIGRRGYTGHSMLGAMGLIHMNGRVQDAITGRFLSADPTIPNPGFTQSYNRYSYVNNNPLTYIDPSGFCNAIDKFAPPCQELDPIDIFGNRGGGGGPGGGNHMYGGPSWSAEDQDKFNRLVGPAYAAAMANQQSQELEEVVVRGKKAPKPQEKVPERLKDIESMRCFAQVTQPDLPIPELDDLVIGPASEMERANGWIPGRVGPAPGAPVELNPRFLTPMRPVPGYTIPQFRYELFDTIIHETIHTTHWFVSKSLGWDETSTGREARKRSAPYASQIIRGIAGSPGCGH